MFATRTAAKVAIALTCLLLVSAPAHEAAAQKPKEEPLPKGFESPGSKLESCGNMLAICQSFRKGLSNKVKTLEGQVKTLTGQVNALKQQIDILEQQAALPACVNKLVWTHPTIPSIDCAPYVCGKNPYTCTLPCDSLQDCAIGLVCSAEGKCIPMPKDDPPDGDGF